MHPFWGTVTRPLLDAASARVVVEIGAEQGRTTTPLVEWAKANGATVHSIDPQPRFDVARAEFEHGKALRFHRARSIDALPAIGAVDAALIDGDHNWYTVSSELSLLARGAAGAGRPLPLIVAHDAGWPYGRRDMYYDPRSIPQEHRQDAARAGMLPGRSELGSPGINAGLWNATHEGGPRNGVLTAIEDFAAEQAGSCELIVVGGWHGLAVLASEERLDASPALRRELARLRSSEFLAEQVDRIELARIRAELGRQQAERQRAAAAAGRENLERTLLNDSSAGEDGE